MLDIKLNILDLIESERMGILWCLDDGKLRFEYKELNNSQKKALEIMSTKEEVIESLNKYIQVRNNKVFINTFEMDIDKKTVAISLTGAINNKGVLCGFATDLTSNLDEEIRIKRLAYYDTLTGLPNRHLIKEVLTKELNKASRGKSKGAVFFIDLDKFKDVNDELGHSYGDMLLKNISSKLINCLRSYDLVGRLSGDEFVIVQTDIKQEQDAEGLANKVLKLFNKKWKLNSHEVEVYGSIGIAFYPKDGNTVEELLQKADKAMYESKNKKGNRFTIYTKQIHDEYDNKMKTIEGLRKALVNEELLLYYHPQIDLSTDKIIGIEALVRWNKTGKGVIEPADFIQISEECGIISQIGEFVIEQGIKDLHNLEKELLPTEKIIINCSDKQFRSRSIIDYIESKLECYNVPKSKLLLEMHENDLLNINKIILRELGDLIAKGIYGTIIYEWPQN